MYWIKNFLYIVSSCFFGNISVNIFPHASLTIYINLFSHKFDILFYDLLTTQTAN